jgi:pimeloyl-ACP methyl ester carboxylesterase
VRGAKRGGEVVDASWPSESEPFHHGVRDTYLGYERNRTAHARMWLAPEPRPMAILIHGYMAGQWAVEERAWPIDWLTRRGLDVAIAVLPFHALRGNTDQVAPPFPGADPRFTNEGFRQAIHDLRALVAYARVRGAPHVGVMGMSLGGYTTSLLATVEPDLAFAVPIIPLASIADFARDRGRLGTEAQSRAQHAALEAANAIVSPLARKSLVAKDHVLVVGADADRITPIAHAERLARHFDAPLVKIHGGHLLQFGRRSAFKEIGRMLRRIGIAD